MQDNPVSPLPPDVRSPLLTAAAAARYLHVAVGTLANWRCSNRGPQYVRVGRAAHYRVRDLDRWLARQTFPQTAAEPREAAQRSQGEYGRVGRSIKKSKELAG